MGVSDHSGRGRAPPGVAATSEEGVARWSNGSPSGVSAESGVKRSGPRPISNAIGAMKDGHVWSLPLLAGETATAVVILLRMPPGRSCASPPCDPPPRVPGWGTYGDGGWRRRRRRPLPTATGSWGNDIRSADALCAPRGRRPPRPPLGRRLTPRRRRAVRRRAPGWGTHDGGGRRRRRPPPHPRSHSRRLEQ